MRSVRTVMAVGVACLLLGVLGGGCSTHTLRERPRARAEGPRVCACHHERHCRACHQRRPCDASCARRAPAPPRGVRWDVVFPPPEVARMERRYDRGWAPEYGRSDDRLSPRFEAPIDAISASWPRPWRPDLDFERTGRTSTDPERFIYSSHRPYLPWRSRRHRGYSR